MTQRASDSVVAILIRVGLLLALGIMLMAENAMAQTGGAASSAPASAPSAAPAPATLAPGTLTGDWKSTLPLDEDMLRAKYVGKLIFLRGSYMGDNLEFDTEGKITGSPVATSFTLSAFEIRSVKLSKHKLEFEADRYGLHFFGALPYEDEKGPAYDKVKISNKPVHISIEREVIIIPKAKKEKKKKATSEELAAAQTLKSRGTEGAQATAASAVANQATPNQVPSPAAAKPATSAAQEEANKAMAASSPEHSAAVMNKALDTIFAADLDPRMMSHLPDYWQEYFKSRSEHRPFTPSDTRIRTVSEGMTAPKVLNNIDPSSNEYAQQSGIAGMEQLRTVVNANGIPGQIAIARPIGFGLDEKAVEAIKNSRFAPATLNGQAVPVVVDLVITFRIYSDRTRPEGAQKPEPGKAKSSVLAASVTDASANLAR
jgi:TonB family protein